MTKTEHYQLNQWDATDQVKRTDFNEDNAKVEEALAGLESSKAESTSVNAALAELRATDATKADSSSVDSRFSTVNSRLNTLEGRVEVYAGSYIGDGQETRTISLGFTPKAVLLEYDNGSRTGRGGMIMPGIPLEVVANVISAEIVPGGFQVGSSQYKQTNSNNAPYMYLALR